jgi:hypothetical protein
MPLTQQDIDSFHRYASAKIGNGGAALSLTDLAAAWQAERDTDQTHLAIQRGLADADAGRHRSLDEFMAEFRQVKNISAEA